MKNIYKKLFVILMILILMTNIMIVPKVNIAKADAGVTFLVAGTVIVLFLIIGTTSGHNLLPDLFSDDVQVKTNAEIYISEITEEFKDYLQATYRNESYNCLVNSGDAAIYSDLWEEWFTSGQAASDIQSVNIDFTLLKDWLMFWKDTGMSIPYDIDNAVTYPLKSISQINYYDTAAAEYITMPMHYMTDINDISYNDVLTQTAFNDSDPNVIAQELVNLGYIMMPNCITSFDFGNGYIIEQYNPPYSTSYLYKNGVKVNNQKIKLYHSYIDMITYYSIAYIASTSQIYISVFQYKDTALNIGYEYHILQNVTNDFSDISIISDTIDISDVPVSNDIDISDVDVNSGIDDIADVFDGATVDADADTIDIPTTTYPEVITESITNVYNEYVNTTTNEYTTVNYNYPEYEEPDIENDDINRWKLPAALRTRFPFCLPWDLINLLGSFEAEMQAPEITLDYELYMMGTPLELNIEIPFEDLGIDVIATITRYASVISFILGLIFISRKMIMS